MKDQMPSGVKVLAVSAYISGSFTSSGASTSSGGRVFAKDSNGKLYCLVYNPQG